ncbi:MAG: DUF1761 domain-containing protein [Saprospiraceae bacterium]|nr:DUF1761 domain-containing protein [Saprospiraceae bacterium]MBK8448673.1 DUF1761 domain-containing protein [Saprospiraceae bacterium]MBK9722812.1 DUF1761 domain-containing protein [Saprospiraceae bacterium]
MSINWLVVLGAGFIPLILGFIWYHPKVFGTIWIQLAGVSEEKAKQSNMALIFGVTLLLGIFLSAAMLTMVIHQTHMMSSLMNIPGFGVEGSEVNTYYLDFLNKYGNEFRTFKHGALHGMIGGILIAFPIVSVNAMFEQRSFKYILINAGFWTACMILIGGVISAFA